MTRRGTRTCIEVDAHHGRFLCVRGSTVIAGGAVHTPSGEYGERTRAVLEAAKSAGGGLGSVVIAMHRSDVVLKTVPLPGSGLAEADRPGYVRLQIARQLPFDVSGATIDFAEAKHEPAALLAGAVRTSVVDAAREAVRQAGGQLERIVLADDCVAALLRDEPESASATLCVGVWDHGCSLQVVYGGSLLLSRACEWPGEAGDAIASVVTEARRTLLSYRVRPDARPVEGVRLIAEDSAVESLREPLCKALEITDVSGLDPIQAAGLSGAADADAKRLAGFVIDRADGINFASPKRAPDRAARTRQLVMLAVLLVLLVGGAWFTMGLREVAALRSELTILEEQRGDVTQRAGRAVRSAGRLDHARSWLAGDADWGGHLRSALVHAPGPELFLLDRLDLNAKPGVDYDGGRSRRYDPGKWRSPFSLTFTIAGRAANEQVATELRAALIDEEQYVLAPIGEDGARTTDDRYPSAFGVTLSSRTPVPPADATAGEEQGGGTR